MPKALEFIRLETSSGIFLFIATLLALILDNSIYQQNYQYLFNTRFGLELNGYQFYAPLSHWINDGLMTIFFLLVGLEIKAEIIEGQLNSLKKMSLPGIAALGGMFVPAFIYILVNYYHPHFIKGWAIPTATDIAFALAALSSLGKRIPTSLKIFLTALAIFDDVGAIIIIALFYIDDISLQALAWSTACVFILWALNFQRITALWPYLVAGFLLWLCILNSGVHPTIAGVILALAIPLRMDPKSRRKSPLRKLEKALHPFVAYLILPLFGFANAGINFSHLQWNSFISPLSLGIILGLVIGKHLGVFGSSYLAIKYGLAKMPAQSGWLELSGVAFMCGIGFTMSLFIGALAFGNGDAQYMDIVRSAVLFGSLVSCIAGYTLLHFASRKKMRGIHVKDTN